MLNDSLKYGWISVGCVRAEVLFLPSTALSASYIRSVVDWEGAPWDVISGIVAGGIAVEVLLASAVVVVRRVVVVVKLGIELAVVVVSVSVVVDVKLAVMVIVEVVSIFVDVEVELVVTVVVEVVSVFVVVFVEFGITVIVTEVVCGIFAASFLSVVMVAFLAKKDH